MIWRLELNMLVQVMRNSSVEAANKVVGETKKAEDEQVISQDAP